MSYEVRVEDVEYIRHGSTGYLATIYRPQGAGPFPMMVELHGGAWCRSDRHGDKVIHEALAKTGVVVAALDWRQPPTAPYPASFQDIHYGIRWLKSRATDFRSRADLVGSMGNSSGGHQAVLLAISQCQLGRAAHAPRHEQLQRRDTKMQHRLPEHGEGAWNQQLHQAWIARPLHATAQAGCVRGVDAAYWKTEEAMAEGAPAGALERGEKVQLPPVLYLQGTDDLAHPRPHLDRFVAAYRKAGGVVDLELFNGEGQGFIMRKVGSPASNRALDLIAEFTHKQLR